MSKPYPFIIQGANITVVIGSTPFTVSKTHITYPQVLEAIKAGDWDRVKEIIDPVKVVLSFGQGNVSIEGDVLMWKGRPLHSSLAARMISMLQEGFDIKPMANFMENLFQNPSKRAVDELYSFLEKNSLPITPDGHFLAYKRVRENYTDCHTGTMDNSIGKVVEMERNEVDDDRDRTCSTGLHFCAHSYLNHFGGDRVVIVKINPADVVSIPSDYNDAKGRACRYEVIGEVGNTPDDGTEFNRSVQSNANSYEGDSEIDEEEEWEWDADGFDDSDTDYDIDCNEDLVPDESTPEILEEVKPKTGSGMFIRGYDDGYNGGDRKQNIANTPAGQKFYNDGWKQGESDAWDCVPARFRYVEPVRKPNISPLEKYLSDPSPSPAWPFPTSRP